MKITREQVLALPIEKQREVLALLEELEEYNNTHVLELYKPYIKQKEFHAAGKSHRERLFSAGNQLGKSLAGGAEVAMHLTGIYPDWWEGRRITYPNKWWVAGESGESTRDNPQRILLGDIGEKGTGMIPSNCIGDATKARGVSDLFDHIPVKHISGGWSHLYFKSYGKGREKWAGVTLDGGLWFDEEPGEDVYSEGLTRTNTKLAPVIVTFTPLKGMSKVVSRFVNESNKDRNMTVMTIEDVVKEGGHYTQEQMETIIAQYPEHEREARSKGVPMLGSGLIFPVTEESIKIDPIEIQPWWFRICGIDFGTDHPFGAAWLAWDKDSDIVYVHDCYKERRATPIIHAAAIKPKGNLPVAWPHDGLQTEKGTGVMLKDIYRKQGLPLLSKPARYGDSRGNFVEPGILDMLQRMETGRFKVFSTLSDWWEEFRMYHRKDGKVVKERDDLMSATRYGMMSLNYAVQYSAQPKKKDFWDRAFENEDRSTNWKTA